MTDPLHEFLKLAEAEFGENVAIILNENKMLRSEVIPSGVAVIDEAIGIGGFPRGRISEVFGAEGCGKTTLCVQAIAQAQKQGKYAAIIDAEHAISPDRMVALGVDISKLVVSQPDSGEQALDLVEMMTVSDKFAIIVVDSVAALTPQVEIDKDMGESVMGVHARLMSQAMRKLAGPVSKHNVALVFTNQTRANIGGYGNPTTTTGGNALKFYASLRLEMKYMGAIKDSGGTRISGKYKMTVVKNKLAIPYKVAEFELNEYGIDGDGNFIDSLVEAGVVDKSGAFYKFEGETIAQGKQAFSTRLKESPELRDKLVQSLHSNK